jgi:hypothetical protein
MSLRTWAALAALAIAGLMASGALVPWVTDGGSAPAVDSPGRSLLEANPPRDSAWG